MAQYIKQGNIFGRIGSGIGKGLAEQVPKEIERSRLSEGLQDISQRTGQTPFQQFASLLSLPGITPQAIQSGSELLRQQGMLQNLQQEQQKQQQQQRSNQLPVSDQVLQQASQVDQRSLTTPRGVQATLNPFIPPSGEEQEAMARKLFVEQPQVYHTLDEARHAVNNKIAANQRRSDALINSRKLENDVQTEAENRLKNEINKLGANIPGRDISQLEKRAVEDIRTGALTEEEAAKKYGAEADKISRDYANVRSWGGIDLITNHAKDLRSAIKSVQKSFAARGRQRDLADTMIAENGLSTPFAYSLAMPVSDIKSLHDQIKALPVIKPELSSVGGGLSGLGITGVVEKERQQKTNNIVPRLARLMGKEGSPLAVAHELQEKGYDPQVWKDYLIENQKDLDLTTGQIEELGKTDKNFMGWLNDLWLKTFSGEK